MHLFDFIQTMDSSVLAEKTKIHLARWDGTHDPLQMFMEGTFDEWQYWQTKRNFERPFVVALIQQSSPDLWLFAGLYSSHGYKVSHKVNKRAGHYVYDLRKRNPESLLSGRLEVRFVRPGRQSYLVAEKWLSQMTLHQVRPARYSVEEFPGYKLVSLRMQKLRTVFKEQSQSWRAALSSVAGVYLISDETSGGLYVGSAYGAGGIWQRWSQYVTTGHGDNHALKRLLRRRGQKHADSFRFSVLEIADTHASKDDICKRETHWKEVLLTRNHGLNRN